MKVLEGYITELETIVNQYDKSNAEYEELRKRFEATWKEEFKGKPSGTTEGTD